MFRISTNWRTGQRALYLRCIILIKRHCFTTLRSLPHISRRFPVRGHSHPRLLLVKTSRTAARCFHQNTYHTRSSCWHHYHSRFSNAFDLPRTHSHRTLWAENKSTSSASAQKCFAAHHCSSCRSKPTFIKSSTNPTRRLPLLRGNHCTSALHISVADNHSFVCAINPYASNHRSTPCRIPSSAPRHPIFVFPSFHLRPFGQQVPAS